MNQMKYNQIYLTMFSINGKILIKQSELFKLTNINLEQIIKTEIYKNEIYYPVDKIINIDFKKLKSKSEVETIKQLKLNIETYLKERELKNV